MVLGMKIPPLEKGGALLIQGSRPEEGASISYLIGGVIDRFAS